MIFIDPDGRTIYDSNGNEIMVEKDKETKRLSFSTSNGEEISEDSQKYLNLLNEDKHGRKTLKKLARSKDKFNLRVSDKIGIEYNAETGTIILMNGYTQYNKEDDSFTLNVYTGIRPRDREHRDNMIREGNYEILERTENYWDGQKLIERDPDWVINQTDTNAESIAGTESKLSSSQNKAKAVMNIYKYANDRNFIRLTGFHEAQHGLGDWSESSVVNKEIKYFNKITKE